MYNACPPSLAFISYATFWSQPTDGTPDFFHACTNPLSIIHVPNTIFGFQIPHSGLGYAGFALYRPAPATYMEYIETGLSSPLVAGMTYDISFYVSLADESNWAIDQIGAYLSVGAVGPVPILGPLSLVPQITNSPGNHITNKNLWTLVTGSYTALGGEDHIVIGNFDAGTTVVPVSGGTINDAYYFIDDISVCPKIMVSSTEINRLSKVNVYPNPAGEIVSVDLSTLLTGTYSIRISGMTGQVFSETNIKNDITVQHLNTGELKPGMYLIQAVAQGRILSVSKFVKM
jgi:hypothetical protein